MANYYIKENNAKSILVNNVTASDTTLVVASSTTFPNFANFIVTIWDKLSYSDPGDDPTMEIVLVTAISGPTFTITRAQESTSAKIHLVRHAVELLITAAQIVELETAIDTKVTLANIVKHETPTPATDGARKIFTVANAYVGGTLDVYVEGILDIPTTDFSETSSTTFTRIIAPDSDEKIRVSYIKQ